MRIVFLGTVEFSRTCLLQILRSGGNVVAVLTRPPVDRGFNSDYADLTGVAREHHLDLYHVKKINDPATISLIRSLQPDVMFVFGWSQLISVELLKIPAMGCIGSHPALLPRNRGRHPLIWALVEGLDESGLTFFYMDEGADSGAILWQKAFPISLEDDAGTLYRKIQGLAEEAIAEFLPQLQQGKAPRLPQNHALATYWRKRTAKDGEIEWSGPTMKIYNLVRALTHPYVGAHTFLGGNRVTVWRAALPETAIATGASDLPPGTVFAKGETGLQVRTGDGYLRLWQWETTDGTPVKMGDRLGGCL